MYFLFPEEFSTDFFFSVTVFISAPLDCEVKFELNRCFFFAPYRQCLLYNEAFQARGVFSRVVEALVTEGLNRIYLGTMTSTECAVIELAQWRFVLIL